MVRDSSVSRSMRESTACSSPFASGRKEAMSVEKRIRGSEYAAIAAIATASSERSAAPAHGAAASASPVPNSAASSSGV